MEQASGSLGLDQSSYYRVKSAYDNAKERDNFDWRMVLQEASVAWENLSGVEWWIVYHTFKAELAMETYEALDQYNKTWEGMSLSVLDKPPSVVGAPIFLSTDEADTNNNEDGMDGARGGQLTKQETKVLTALGIIKYNLSPWELASETCWKFVGGSQLVSWEKYLTLVYQALMNSTAARYYVMFAQDWPQPQRPRGLRFLTDLFGATVQLDSFLKRFKSGSNFLFVRGMGNGAQIRLWKCQVDEMMREDEFQDTMTADDVEDKIWPEFSYIDDEVGIGRWGGSSWKLRGHGRCLTNEEWKRIMETDTDLDALILKCGNKWTELLKRLNIETTRSGQNIKKDFFAHVLPNLKDFGASGKKVVRSLNVLDQYTMITICHSIQDQLDDGPLSGSVMELLENDVLCDRKKNMVESRWFWMRAFTRIFKQKFSQADTVVDVIEFFHMNFEAYQKIFPMIY